MDLIMIAAVADNLAIGYKGELIYRIPEDLKRFKELTLGHPVLMGRRTWNSLPPGKLPGRRKIVLASDILDQFPETDVYYSIEGVLEGIKNEEKVFVIGGGVIYHRFLPYANILELTEIHDSPQKFDTIFPDYRGLGFKEVWREDHTGNPNYSFVRYEREMPILQRAHNR